jgi:hypothetical protein
MHWHSVGQIRTEFPETRNSYSIFAKNLGVVLLSLFFCSIVLLFYCDAVSFSPNRSSVLLFFCSIVSAAADYSVSLFVNPDAPHQVEINQAFSLLYLRRILPSTKSFYTSSTN